jgi:hypothetical protein
VRSDAEGAAPVTVGERVGQYFFDATLLATLDELSVGQLVPFVVGGGGYLRQLHEGHIVVEHGLVFHAGGGAKYQLVSRSTGAIRTTGLRADVRAYFLRGGIAEGSGPRPHLAASGGFFFGF